MDAPRLLYRGPAGDDASVKRFETSQAVTEAVAAGWRLQRSAPADDDPEPVADRNPDSAETPNTISLLDAPDAAPVDPPQSSRKKR